MNWRLLGILTGMVAAGISVGEDAVRELLLTPPEELSAVDCSDDEFFASYATSIRADAETYLTTLQDSVSTEEVAIIRRGTDEFITLARKAYDASLAWADCGNRQNNSYTHAYRNMLRTRLLHDLHLLHATGSPWCSGLDTERLRTPPALPQSEQQIVDGLGGSTAADIALAEQLPEHHLSQIEARRRMLRQVLGNFGREAFLFRSDSPAETNQTDTADFDTAEAAWDTYLTALRRMHHPIITHHTGGSGTPAQVLMAHVLLVMSHEERLDKLSALRAKPYPSQHLTDFSKLEMTEEEKYEKAFEPVKNSKYTPEQKQVLYAKASGVEKLLRTPTEMRDPYHNEQAWSDEEFFTHYTAAIREDMEKFIGEEILGNHYLERYGKEQQDADIAHCRQMVDKLFRKTPDKTDQSAEKEPHFRKAAELFREAEKAWIAYIKVLNNINYPVDNSSFSGSGTGGFIHEFSANAIQSHNSFLPDIISFAGGGMLPSAKVIDFTQYEETKEASEMINQIPG